MTDIEAEEAKPRSRLPDRIRASVSTGLLARDTLLPTEARGARSQAAFTSAVHASACLLQGTPLNAAHGIGGSHCLA